MPMLGGFMKQSVPLIIIREKVSFEGECHNVDSWTNWFHSSEISEGACLDFERVKTGACYGSLSIYSKEPLQWLSCQRVLHKLIFACEWAAYNKMPIDPPEVALPLHSNWENRPGNAKPPSEAETLLWGSCALVIQCIAFHCAVT